MEIPVSVCTNEEMEQMSNEDQKLEVAIRFHSDALDEIISEGRVESEEFAVHDEALALLLKEFLRRGEGEHVYQ